MHTYVNPFMNASCILESMNEIYKKFSYVITGTRAGSFMNLIQAGAVACI